MAGRIGGQAARKRSVSNCYPWGSPAKGITVQYDRTMGLKEVPIKNELGEFIGLEFVEEQEEIVGSQENPMIEGYVHVSQQTKNVNLGPKPGMESSFSLKSIRTNNLGMGENKRI